MNLPTRVAICYDWFDTPKGGVERVLVAINELFPHAHWYGAQQDAQRSSFAAKHPIHTSFIQRIPRPLRNLRALMLPLYPLAVETWDFRSYDLVISITSAFTKGIITSPPTRHLCYLLTPPRYLYEQQSDYLSGLAATISKPIQNALRTTDFFQAQRPDQIYSISKRVQARCRTHYQRDSEVIYPPFDTDYWKSLLDRSSSTPPHPTPYYLIVNRIEPYKKTESAIEACLSAGVCPVVIGSGSLQSRLQQRYPTVSFLHNVSDEEIATWYQHASALIMVQEEDFGLTALEAQFAGCPVITYQHSGASETIIEGQTGATFSTQDPTELAQVLTQFEQNRARWKQTTMHFGSTHVAKQFAKKRFMQTFSAVCSVS